MSKSTTVTTPDGLSYTYSTTVVSAVLASVTEYTVSITDKNGVKVLPSTTLSSGLTVLGLNIAPTGGVVTGSDGIATLVGIGSATYVTVPGSTGGISVIANVASGTKFFIGGNTDIDIAVNALSGNTIDIYGGTATFSGNLVAGLLSGSTINIGYGGTYNGGSNLISILTGSTVNFTTGGGTLVINADNNVLNLLATNNAKGVAINNYDPSVDTIQLKNTVAPISKYTISGSGTAKTVTLYAADGSVVASYQANLASGISLANGSYTATDNANDPLKISYINGNTDIGVCFLADSMISTPDGEAPVQDLKIGDQILAYTDGRVEIRSVTWAGKASAKIRPTLSDDYAGYPVRIMKGAIDDNVPSQDLLVTPEHCLFFGGKFVPARMLINGHSVVYDRSISAYDYYHIETEGHSVIKANGLLTESYLDTGNRGSFVQTGSVSTIARKEKTWENDAAAKLDVSREFVEPIHHRILSRALARGVPCDVAEQFMESDPEVRLLSENGTEILPNRETEGCVVFSIPPHIRHLRILTRSSRPCDIIGPFVDDRRFFGVRIGAVHLYDVSGVRTITEHLTQNDLGGWHEVQADGTRWTSGNAGIDLGERPDLSFAILSMKIVEAGPYMTGAPQEVLKKTA